MTTLQKPLRRIVETRGYEIVVEIVPSDAGIPAHIKLRVKGERKAYQSLYIEPPIIPVERQLGNGGGR